MSPASFLHPGGLGSAPRALIASATLTRIFAGSLSSSRRAVATSWTSYRRRRSAKLGEFFLYMFPGYRRGLVLRVGERLRDRSEISGILQRFEELQVVS